MASYSGKFEKLDTVIDSELAVQKAGLTVQQMKIVELRWIKGFTQMETAEVLEISQPTVLQHEQYAKKKIQKVLSEWGTAC